MAFAAGTDNQCGQRLVKGFTLTVEFDEILVGSQRHN
jgi:hypothetical protein